MLLSPCTRSLLKCVLSGLPNHRRPGLPGGSPGRGSAAALRAAQAPPPDALRGCHGPAAAGCCPWQSARQEAAAGGDGIACSGGRCGGEEAAFGANNGFVFCARAGGSCCASRSGNSEHQGAKPPSVVAMAQPGGRDATAAMTAPPGEPSSDSFAGAYVPDENQGLHLLNPCCFEAAAVTFLAVSMPAATYTLATSLLRST